MKKVWTTKSGQHLKIKDMGTQHIENCIKLLERYHDAKLKSFVSFGDTLQGEMAQLDFENHLEDLEGNGWEDTAQDYIDSFKQELKRRNENL